MRARFVRLALLDQLGRGDAHARPVGAQRLDDRRPDQPLDIGARRVVGAELGALLGVERALQQRAEDGGLDLRPAMLGRLDQHLQLLGIERDGGAILEQIAVELAQRHAERGREVARVHRRPQGGELVLQMLRRCPLVLEQVGEALLRDQPAVLGEHREEQAHEEAAGALGGVAALLQPAGDGGEQVGDIARDARRAGGGIEARRVASRSPPAARAPPDRAGRRA